MDKLKEELSKPEYQSLTDAEAADRIMAKVVQVRVLVPTSSIKELAIKSGYYADIVIGMNSPVQEIRKLCINVQGWIDDAAHKMQYVDMDDPKSIAMIFGLIAAGIITEPQADAIRSLADKTLLWVDHEGIGQVGIGLIQNARK